MIGPQLSQEHVIWCYLLTIVVSLSEKQFAVLRDLT